MGKLKSVDELFGFSVEAVDGALGHVVDVLFDDADWAIRYLVVDTRDRMPGRRVLISTAAVRRISLVRKTLQVDFVRQDIQSSPDVAISKPVSGRQEVALVQYYRYPYYWAGPPQWGHISNLTAGGRVVSKDEGKEDKALRITRERVRRDPYLRFCSEVSGFDIYAAQDMVGHVDDFIFDVKGWRICMIVVNTRNWWPGKHMLVSPLLVSRVSWKANMIEVDVTRDLVERSPEYNVLSPPSVLNHELYRQQGNCRSRR
ncbi:PRC-barrel domain-containing protein [Noviherbaspirillum sp.]|uniref:PRC-barrel domain-containing protein n=1 Tax=Noviherbaspirillum sp. TaxID=1926288 RepID=UPI002FDF10E9